MVKVFSQHKYLFKEKETWPFIISINSFWPQCMNNESNYLLDSYSRNQVTNLVTDFWKWSFDPQINLLVNELHVRSEIKVLVVFSYLRKEIYHCFAKNAACWSTLPQGYKRHHPNIDLFFCGIVFNWQQETKHRDSKLWYLSIWIKIFRKEIKYLLSLTCLKLEL